MRKLLSVLLFLFVTVIGTFGAQTTTNAVQIDSIALSPASGALPNAFATSSTNNSLDYITHIFTASGGFGKYDIEFVGAIPPGLGFNYNGASINDKADLSGWPDTA